jgi:hypothetical protein
VCEAAGQSPGKTCFSDSECTWNGENICYLDAGYPGYCFKGCQTNQDCEWYAPGHECNPQDGLCYPPEPEPQPDRPYEPPPRVEPPPPPPKEVAPVREAPVEEDNALMWGLIAAGGIAALGGGIYLAKRKKKKGLRR